METVRAEGYNSVQENIISAENIVTLNYRRTEETGNEQSSSFFWNRI